MYLCSTGAVLCGFVSRLACASGRGRKSIGALQAMLCLILSVFCANLAAAQSASSESYGTRVRATDPDVLRLIHSGYDRSPTFRRLVETLDATDIIVYVERVPDLPPPMVGCLQFAGVAGNRRYLRIMVKGRTSPERLIMLIGHELQHAVEVSSAPAVRDDTSLAAFYRSVGERSLRGWETVAARDAGDRVQEELLHAAARALPAHAAPAHDAAPAPATGSQPPSTPK